jgi:hypothetical protein
VGVAVQPLLERVTQAFAARRYRLTAHAEQEREAEAISVNEILEAFGYHRVELIEEYPDDPRGSSALVLGFTAKGQALHGVVGLAEPDIVVVVTVYRPDRTKWENWRRRLRP